MRAERTPILAATDLADVEETSKAGLYVEETLKAAPAEAHGRLSSVRGKAVLLLALAVVAALVLFCAGKGVVWQRATRRRMQAGRACVEMPGIRLADGHGGPLKSINGSTPESCREVCRKTVLCVQSIFSAGNHDCYMFAHWTEKLEEGALNDMFSSVYCSSDERELKSRQARIIARTTDMRLEQTRQQWKIAEERARKVVYSLAPGSRYGLLHGHGGGMGYAGFIPKSVYGYRAPSLKMNDGPQGFNAYQPRYTSFSTQFPCLLAVAASFNTQTSQRYAAAIADEFVAKSSNMLLGPDVEVTRAPLTGRGFETISGEDPYLGSQLVRPYVMAIQSRGIVATVKHWLDNNQEIFRMSMNAEVDDRAQHEIYMAPFKAAFEVGAAAVMCSYNRVHGQHACGNKKLLSTLLREELGFKGFVVSDWGATHDAEASASAGLDVEMPGPKIFQQLGELVSSGSVAQEVIDKMATHVLSSMHFVGLFDGRFQGQGGAWLQAQASTDAHRSVAVDTIIDSAVLLKNSNNVLPLSSEWKKIAFVSRYCDLSFDNFQQGGVYASGGSGFVNTTRTVTPFAAMHSRLQGRAEVFLSADAEGAQGADVAIVCASAHAEEGWDRKSDKLPDALELVQGLRKLPGGGEQRIVVLAIVPGVVATDWVEEADAALMLFMPGEQIGNAVVQLLTGEAGPAGRLPVTMPAKGEQRFTMAQYPGECAPPEHKYCDKMTANFSEGVLVGYRWNDASGTPAAFPFGFGLAYTTFRYSDFRARCVGHRQAEVSFTVSNTGPRAGAAVPQLYVSFPSLRPAVRQLRGFQKVQVASHGTAEIVFLLGEEDWSFYDVHNQTWASAVAKGERVTVYVGTSSAHLLWNYTFSPDADHPQLELGAFQSFWQVMRALPIDWQAEVGPPSRTESCALR